MHSMYAVTKRIEFCYGHRLLDYDGPCRHPHGHNAVVEVEVRADGLDGRNMVVDFGDIKQALKAWIDRELDHRMILHKDDPALAYLLAQGEPIFVMDRNPTAENIARLIYEKTKESGFPVVEVKLWETESCNASYRA